MGCGTSKVSTVDVTDESNEQDHKTSRLDVTEAFPSNSTVEVLKEEDQNAIRGTFLKFFGSFMPFEALSNLFYRPLGSQLTLFRNLVKMHTVFYSIKSLLYEVNWLPLQH